MEPDKLVMSFHRRTLLKNRPAATPPTRYPGDSVLEKDEQCITRPRWSKVLADDGGSLVGCSSPYTSSSINGTSWGDSRSTRACFFSRDSEQPSGFWKFVINQQAFGRWVSRTCASLERSTPSRGCVGTSMALS